jgi:predicted MFS family arabinose efflux permease
VRRLLARRGFRSLLIGQGVSAFGDWMVTVALMVLVLDLTGSSTAVGGMLVLRLMPAMVAGPLATRLVHRWRRRRTMLAADLARAVVVLLIPLVAEAWWVYLWAFVLEVLGLVFLPARDASVPDLAGEEDLPLANGLVLASSYGTILLGAAAFGALAALQPRVLEGGYLGSRPYLLVFVLDAVTFLVSYAFVWRLRELDEPAARPAAPGWQAPTGGRFRDALRLPLVRRIVAPVAAVALGVGTLFSVGIVFVREVLGASESEFGALIVLFGLGALAGLGLHRLLGPGLATVRLTLWGQGATIAVMALAPALAFVYLGAAAFGLFASATLVGGMSLLQARLSGEPLVSAFAVFHVLIRAGLSLAALGAGVAVDLAAAVRLPLLGRLGPARLVLLSAGVLVAASASAVRLPAPEDAR